jgi:hypothetical protein
MANLPLNPVWEEGVYQIENGDDVIAGEDGVWTLPHRQLGNRSEWLKQQFDSVGAALDTINGEQVTPDIAAKLAALSSTKSGIAAAIEGKGIAVPEGAAFSGYGGLISQIIGTAVEVWNVSNSAMVNPGTGIGGIRWNDPQNIAFDHISVMEGDTEAAQIQPGVQAWEPPEGTHEYILKVAFEDGHTSDGFQLPETTYFYSYDAVLQTAIVSMTSSNRLTLSFDNFISITDASGITISGINDAMNLAGQPDNKTIVLELATLQFQYGISYQFNYDAQSGNIELSNGQALPSINSFGITNYSNYGPAQLISAEVPVDEPSTLVLVFSRPVSVESVAGFSLSGTTAAIQSKVSDGSTVELQLSEPVDTSTVEPAIKINFNGTGVTDNLAQPVPAFSNIAVTNNSTNTAVTVQSASVNSNNSRELIVVMTGAVSMANSAGWFITGDQTFNLSSAAYSISDGTIKFTLPSDIYSGKSVSVAYNGTGTVKGSNGDTVHAFTHAVTNNSSAMQGFGPGTEARNLAVVLLGRNCASAAEVDQVFSMVHQTIQSGNAANFALGDYVDLPSLTIAAGYDSGGGISLSITELADTIPMTRFYIVEKNFMKGKNGNTADNVAFQSKNCLGYTGVTDADGHYMNPGNDNTTGYLNCKMRQYLINSVRAALIAAGVKLGAYGYGPSRRVSKGGTAANPGYDNITDDVFIPTEYEMFGSATYSNATAETEQGRFSYYANNNTRIKKAKDGAAKYYWEASPYSGSATHFCIVNSSGAATSNIANNAYGVAPAFCVA